VALRARDGFAQLLAGGITTLICLQALIIMAGSLKLIPLTGITLPFVSYGGSSLMTSYAAVGLLLRISAETTRAWKPPSTSGWPDGAGNRLPNCSTICSTARCGATTSC